MMGFYSRWSLLAAVCMFLGVSILQVNCAHGAVTPEQRVDNVAKAKKYLAELKKLQAERMQYEIANQPIGDEFDGDILKSPASAARGGPCVDCGRWPRREDGLYYVPYVINNIFNQEEKEKILWSMILIEFNTNIRFVEHSDESNWLNIEDGDGCYAILGNAGAGGQLLSLSRKSECVLYYTIIHELFHALGLNHEHTRPDRDEWLDMDYSQVVKGQEHVIAIDEGASTDLSPYDLASVMHYSGRGFATGLRSTIKVKDRTWQWIINVDKIASSCDWFEVNTIYPGEKPPPECVPHLPETLCSQHPKCEEDYGAEFCEAACLFDCLDYDVSAFPTLCTRPDYEYFAKLRPAAPVYHRGVGSAPLAQPLEKYIKEVQPVEYYVAHATTEAAEGRAARRERGSDSIRSDISYFVALFVGFCGLFLF